MYVRVEENKIQYYMKYSVKYHVFPDTFQVISRKVDYLWDSVPHVDCVELLPYADCVYWYNLPHVDNGTVLMILQLQL